MSRSDEIYYCGVGLLFCAGAVILWAFGAQAGGDIMAFWAAFFAGKVYAG